MKQILADLIFHSSCSSKENLATADSSVTVFIYEKMVQ